MKKENEAETTPEEKTTSKMNSRKFIVFIIVCFFCAAAMGYGFFTKETEIVKNSLDIMGFNAGFYVAGNSFSKWARNKNAESENVEE